jgi:hypothetical protein
VPVTALPDFYIIGAQKSGTTSLCALLEQHPTLCLSRPKEPMLLSRDDLSLHPHFFAENPLSWDRMNWEKSPESLTADYQQCFAHAQDGQLKGDGSTSYLYSREVPGRIQQLTPDARIIVVLRDPARRAYSAYWHYVTTGIACEGFAGHLRYESGLTADGSNYAFHLKRWLDTFPREQFLFLCYEEMVADIAATAEKVAAFLKVENWENPQLPKENRGKRPKWLWLQLACNYLRRRAGIPQAATGTGEKQPHPLCSRLADEISKRNLTDAPYPPMNEALLARLHRYYQRTNASLDEMTGLETRSYWYQ